MTEPATDTTYPEAIDLLPHVPPNAAQNEPGLEHDIMHARANAVLNALMMLVGTHDNGIDGGTVLDRLVALEEGSPGIVRLNVQAGASYGLVLSDVGALICRDHDGPNDVVVPLHSTVPFPRGARVDIGQDGVGQTRVVKADPSIVILSPETLRLRKRGAKATLINRGPDRWDLEGNLEAAS
ncbi:hypothetical protein CO641_02445 [Lysobacteraceae bacterium NML91-0213]|nr:hypothetical protein CO641_02445 [Xanthomonadaceae bacterium NML91-0213]